MAVKEMASGDGLWSQCWRVLSLLWDLQCPCLRRGAPLHLPAQNGSEFSWWQTGDAVTGFSGTPHPPWDNPLPPPKLAGRPRTHPDPLSTPRVGWCRPGSQGYFPSSSVKPCPVDGRVRLPPRKPSGWWGQGAHGCSLSFSLRHPGLVQAIASWPQRLGQGASWGRHGWL